MNKLALLLLGAIIPLLGIQGDQNRKQQNRGPVLSLLFTHPPPQLCCALEGSRMAVLAPVLI